MTVVAHDEAQSLKARIFSAAIAVFAEHGLSGARMEQIATEAQTTKRMVVYYFKSKEQLYQEVLQHVYARIRETEQQLGLENVPPVEAWCGWCAGACAITPPMRTICASFAWRICSAASG